MTTLAHVIGYGPNSVAIPLLTFLTAEDAETRLRSLGLRGEDGHFGDIEDADGVVKPLYKVLEEQYGEDEEDEGTEPTGTQALRDAIIEAFFKNGSYYDGCGGVGSFHIVTAEVGAPIVSWDLD